MNRPADPLARDPLALDRVPLSPATFDALRNLLHAHSGIALAHHKITMVPVSYTHLTLPTKRIV